jgi:hypothetical chaperone protein
LNAPISQRFGTACGFDFGTSNTSIATGVGNQPRLIALQDGKTSVPTALFYSFEENKVHYGREAVQRYLAREEGRLMRSLKSLLGSSLYEETTHIKYRRVAFADIVSEFIAWGRAASGGCDHVVMGRPAYFVDDDAEADARAEGQLKAAALAGGFRHVEFQFEPIAAALDYEQSVAREELALVVDIGGGTSDFSIVRVSPDRARRADRQADILGYSGVHIGGTDFDRLLSIATVMPYLGFKSALRTKGMSPPSWYYQDLSTWQRINALYDAKVMTEIKRVRKDALEPEKLDRLMRLIELRKGHELLGQVEETKIMLSDEMAVELASVAFDEGQALVVTRGEFEAAVGDALARVQEQVRATLARAGLVAGAIDTVFLTGGSSAIPALRAMVSEVLPSARMIEGDAFGSVATGLAIEAQRRFG